MRTDVKIGIAVGLVLVVGVVVYMVVSPGSSGSPEENPPVVTPGGGGGDTSGTLGSGNPDGSIADNLFPSRPTEPWAPGVGGTGDTTGAGAGDTTGAGAGDTTGAGAGDTTGAGAGDTTGAGTGDTTAAGTGDTGTDSDPRSVEITMVPSGPVDPGPADSSWPSTGGDSSAGPVDPGSPPTVPYSGSTGVSTGGAGAAVTGTVKTHVIRSNDKLWTLAETYYGHGKHWQHLVTANPGLSPNALVVGRTIKIPPLPAGAVSSVPPAVVVTGTITQAADGTKTYIVARGDSFWKIAARGDVYGNGIHYKLIATANPGANSNSLQPGDKLVIPPLATSSTSGGTSSPAAAPDPVAAAGEKIYVVKQGDDGMWGVSNSQYGDGKYFPAIAGRNPGVNPSRLRIGQKLVLPSLEQAKAFLSGSSGRAPVSSSGAGGTSSGGTSVPIPARTPRPVPAPAAAGGDGEPDFS